MKIICKSFLIVFTLLMLHLKAAPAADSSLGVKTGTDAALDTQTVTDGRGTVHREVVVVTYTTTHDERLATWNPVPSATSAIFSVPTKCVSVLVVADASNPDAVWVNPAGDAVAGASVPIYPGTRQVFRAPNSGDCSSIKIIRGTSCATSCKAYVLSQ